MLGVAAARGECAAVGVGARCWVCATAAWGVGVRGAAAAASVAGGVERMRATARWRTGTSGSGDAGGGVEHGRDDGGLDLRQRMKARDWRVRPQTDELKQDEQARKP